ncbi:MAG: YSC84-related protein [bacterium]
MNNFLLKLSVFTLCLTFVAGVSTSAEAASREERREDVRTQSTRTLNRLYSSLPGTESVIKKAYGYAVFSNFGMKLFVVGGGKGRGIAVENSTGKEVFMRMVELQAGLGFGIKQFSMIFVFDNQTVFNNFTESGWQLGGQGTAAVKTTESGSALENAIAVSSGVWVYQLTEKGLALELTGKGTRYYRDKKLN